MADDSVKRYPGSNDISAQFSAANIGTALTDYQQIMDAGGDYEFGELTAKFYNLNQSDHQHWKDDIATFYPPDIQNEIKRHIIYALTHTDDHGHPRPIPLSINWNTTGAKSVTCTYDPSGHGSYTILISGYRSPLASPFAERRGKY
jgi:hypothetical protein